MNKKFEYPYPMHDQVIELKTSCNPVIELETSQDENQSEISTYNVYAISASTITFEFTVTCKSVDDSNYSMVINVNSPESFFRHNLTQSTKKGDQYYFSYEFEKKDWTGLVTIQALLILKNNKKAIIGTPYKKGQKYGSSKEVFIRFTEPEESKSSGKNLKFSWVNFAAPKKKSGVAMNGLKWLKDHKNDIYAIDYNNIDEDSQFPRVYLNKNMNRDHKKLMDNQSKRDGLNTSHRNILFNKLASEITILLVLEAISSLKSSEYDSSVKAWENLEPWEKNVLEKSYKLFDVSKEEYNDELFRAVRNPLAYVKLIKNFPNKLQQSLNSSDTLMKGFKIRRNS